MKILITLIKWKGGVGRVVKNQKRELEKLGHEVDVMTRKKKLKVLRDSSYYDILFTQDWSCALPLMLEKNHYVCFHGHNPQRLGYIIQTIIGKLKGKKLFVVGDTLKKRFPKATLLYNAVDTEEFYDLKKERKYLGWIERDYETMNKEDMIKYAKREGLKLSIAKDIPPNEMNKWYNSLKMFASFPKWFAGFNLCWLEALSAGVPRVEGNEYGIGIDNAKKKWKELTWERNVEILLGGFGR